MARLLPRRRGRHRRRGRLQTWARRILITLLVGPALIILLYRVVPPPVTPLMLIRVTGGEGLAYDWTAMDSISPHLARAVIAAEDNRFCEHWGFDFGQLQDAIEDWQKGDRLRGASTISMQTAKNVFLWPRSHMARKVAEAWLTPQLELLWPKRRILEVYLNVAEMGPGIYGAEAAARHYFGKPAAKLTVREASLVAAVLPNPRRWSPARPTSYIANRAAVIRKRIGQLGPMLDCAE